MDPYGEDEIDPTHWYDNEEHEEYEQEPRLSTDQGVTNEEGEEEPGAVPNPEHWSFSGDTNPDRYEQKKAAYEARVRLQREAQDREIEEQLAIAAIHRKQQQDETKAARITEDEELRQGQQYQQRVQQHEQRQEPEQAIVRLTGPLHQKREVIDLEMLDAALEHQQQQQVLQEQQQQGLDQPQQQQEQQEQRGQQYSHPQQPTQLVSSGQSIATSMGAAKPPRKKQVTIDLTGEDASGPRQTRKEAALEAKITTASTSVLEGLALEEDDKLFAVTCMFCKNILIVITKRSRAEVPLACTLAICVCAKCEELEGVQYRHEAAILPYDMIENWHHGRCVRKHLDLKLRREDPYILLTAQGARTTVDTVSDRLLEGSLINDQGFYGSLWLCKGIPKGFL